MHIGRRVEINARWTMNTESISGMARRRAENSAGRRSPPTSFRKVSLAPPDATTTSAGVSMPAASTTPVTRPSSTAMWATGRQVWIAPPCDAILAVRASTQVPMPSSRL